MKRKEQSRVRIEREDRQTEEDEWRITHRERERGREREERIKKKQMQSKGAGGGGCSHRGQTLANRRDNGFGEEMSLTKTQSGIVWRKKNKTKQQLFVMSKNCRFLKDVRRLAKRCDLFMNRC